MLEGDSELRLIVWKSISPAVLTVTLAVPLIGVKGAAFPEKPFTVVEIELPVPTGTGEKVVPSVVASNWK